MLEWTNNGLIQNYCKKFCKENIWKVKNLGYEFEDLMQDCWIEFNNCNKKFKGNSDAEFMSFFITSLRNMITSLSWKDTKEKNLKFKIFMWEDETPDIDDIVNWNLKWENMPEKIKKGINIAINYPKNKLTSRILQSLMDINQRKNIITEIKEEFLR